MLLLLRGGQHTARNIENDLPTSKILPAKPEFETYTRLYESSNEE